MARKILSPAKPPDNCTVQQIRDAVKKVSEERKNKDIVTTRKIWVAYNTEHGEFVCTRGTTPRFDKARTFGQRNHLSSSVGTQNIESGKIIPIPVKMELELDELMVTILRGKHEDDIKRS